MFIPDIHCSLTQGTTAFHIKIWHICSSILLFWSLVVFSFWVLLVTCFTYIELYWCRWITLSLPGTSVMNCKQFLVERGWSVSWMEVLCQKLETYWTILMQFDIQTLSVMFDFFSFVNKTWEDCMLVFFLLHTCKCM